MQNMTVRTFPTDSIFFFTTEFFFFVILPHVNVVCCAFYLCSVLRISAMITGIRKSVSMYIFSFSKENKAFMFS